MSEDITPPQHELLAPEEKLLKVASSGNPQTIAAAIAHALYENKHVKLRAVGAGAVNQAVKAIAIASGYVAVRGMVLNSRPGFMTIKSRDGEISAIVFTVTAD
jgi:stage V sporulation protein S